MTLTFEHAGRTYTLTKHPRAIAQLRAGQISPEAAAAQAWYLRITLDGQRKNFSLPANNKHAIAAARDLLNGARSQPGQFSAWLAERTAAKTLTIGTLAKEWLAAGCPLDTARPRKSAAANRLAETLTRALKFWAAHRVASVTHKTMHSFAAHVRTNIYGGTRSGDRTVDIQLAALSCLCQWAVLTDRIEANPFAKRQRLQHGDTIKHCSDFMPHNDEQLHQLLAWCWADADHTRRVIAGGALGFAALSGLRPGEVHRLRWMPAANAFPQNLLALQPGQIYPMPDGHQRMAVARLKGGQNPAIIITPVLDQFLVHWEHYLHTLDPKPAYLFPETQEYTADVLAEAVAVVNLPPLHSHGMRAYYVRVRRSQGADDAQIAVELGHSSNGKLIRDVYGEPRDPVGGNLHDWLPADRSPAWEQLTREPSNIIAL